MASDTLLTAACSALTGEHLRSVPYGSSSEANRNRVSSRLIRCITVKPLQEHDRVVLTVDVPMHKLAAGDVGTVVHRYDQGTTFEVEFVALDGETCAVVTLAQHQLRPVQRHELVHARRMA
jgi:hypothetical protein